MCFKISLKLPSLNEYTASCRAHAQKGASLKRDTEYMICWDIQRAISAKQLRQCSAPIRLAFEWHERTKKRDADNIAFAKKFILDALVKMRIIVDDGRKYVKGFTDEIIDDKADFVIVKIFEEGEQK